MSALGSVNNCTFFCPSSPPAPPPPPPPLFYPALLPLRLSSAPAGSLNASCATAPSVKSGPWTTTWNCTTGRNRTSVPGRPATTPSSTCRPWRTTTGHTLVRHSDASHLHCDPFTALSLHQHTDLEVEKIQFNSFFFFFFLTFTVVYEWRTTSYLSRNTTFGQDQFCFFHFWRDAQHLTKQCWCGNCENLTLIMNLHSFVWNKYTHVFWLGAAMTCPSVLIFQHPQKVKN